MTIKLGPPSAHRVSNSDLELRAHSKGLQEHIPNLHRERTWSPLPTNRGNVCKCLPGTAGADLLQTQTSPAPTLSSRTNWITVSGKREDQQVEEG